MTESPDSPAEAASPQADDQHESIAPADADGKDAAADKKGTTKAGKDDDEPKLPRRERVLRLALITVGAALVASIFSLYSQRDDTDPSAAVSQTVEAESGTVTVAIEVSTDDADQGSEIVTLFDGDDYDTTLSIGGDSSAYSTSTSVQQLVTVDGQSYYRSGDDAWVEADPSAVVLDEELALPLRTLGWSSEGLDVLVGELDLAADNTVVSDILQASITVAEARALDSLPLAVEVLTDAGWAWTDDQPIEVEVTLDGGKLVSLSARAADERPERVGGLLSVATSTSYAGLGDEVTLVPPTE